MSEEEEKSRRELLFNPDQRKGPPCARRSGKAGKGMSDQLVRLEREGDVFILNMAADENRWNTSLVAAYDAALDEVEASVGPVALVTASDSEKFFL